MTTLASKKTEPDKTTPRRVPCQTCHVAGGKTCVRPSGHPLFGGGSHASRIRAAGLDPADYAYRDVGRKTPENVLVVHDEGLALQRYEQRVEALRAHLAAGPPRPPPPVRVPNDPPDMFVDVSPLGAPLYTTKLGRMFCGNSLNIMPKLAPGRVDLCFTSPPYALVRKKEYGNQAASEYVRWFIPFVHQVRRLLTPTGFFVLNLGPAWMKGEPCQSTYDVETMLAVADRLYPLLDAVWYKAGTIPGPAEWVTVRKIRATIATEMVWVFSKDPYAFDELPSDVEFDTFLSFPNKDSNSEYHRRCRQFGVKQHPARFPPKLVEYFVERLTPVGGHVLDPFGGSNTTGAVAEAMGRSWTSIELDAEYAKASWLRFGETPLKLGGAPREALDVAA